MVLNRSLLIFYSSPGVMNPSFILPLQASMQLRRVLSPSSNKMGPGIVGNHLQQRGFALFEPTDGLELFFVASSQSDHNMWVSAIYSVLKKGPLKHQVSVGVDEISADNVDGAEDSYLPIKNDKHHEEKTSMVVQQAVGWEDYPGLGYGVSANSASEMDEPTDDVDMDTISLSESSTKLENKVFCDSSNFNDKISTLASLSETPTQPVSMSWKQENSVQPFLSHIRMAKGKSRFASSKSLLGSALKTAKGGVLAASEIGSNGIKQVLAREELHTFHTSSTRECHQRSQSSVNNMPTSSNFGTERPLAVAQKMSTLKKNANNKLSLLSAVVRSSIQDESEMSVHTQLPDATVYDNQCRPRSVIAESNSSATLAMEEVLDSQPNTLREREQQSQSSDNNVPTSSNVVMEHPLVVGQKISIFKNNANTKLSLLSNAERSSTEDQSTMSVHTQLSDTNVHDNQCHPSVLMEKFNSCTRAQLTDTVDESHVGNLTYKSFDKHFNGNEIDCESSVQVRSGKQELLKRFANLDQSMSNTVRRLKIDEKMTQISAAVKSIKHDGQVRRQLSNASLSHTRNSEQSKLRIGIGEEDKLHKPIRFNARETFDSSSGLPVKVKSIKSGDVLSEDLPAERGRLQRKIEGIWVIKVDAIITSDAVTQSVETSDTSSETGKNLATPQQIDQKAQAKINDHEHIQWKYKITSTEIGNGSEITAQTSAERTITDVFMFHALISEILANHSPYAREIYQEDVILTNNISPVFQNVSPLERLRVSGSLLQKMLNVETPSASVNPSVRENHCKFQIPIFSGY